MSPEVPPLKAGPNAAAEHWANQPEAGRRRDLLDTLRRIAKGHGRPVRDANAAYRAAMQTLGLPDALPK